MADDPTADADPAGADPTTRADPADDDPLAGVSAELHRKSAGRRALEGLVSAAALVVMFALVLPKVTGSTYHDVAHELDRLSPAKIAALGAVWAIGIVAYAGVLTAVLPGLRRVQGVVLNTATSAVSNVVPFGGAVGVGATYGINRSWGFGAPAITLAILVSGVWNVFLKLGLPVVALVLLVFAGEATSGLVIAAAIGFVALAASVLVLTLVMRSEQLAGAVGRVVLGDDDDVLTRLEGHLERERREGLTLGGLGHAGLHDRAVGSLDAPRQGGLEHRRLARHGDRRPDDVRDAEDLGALDPRVADGSQRVGSLT